MSDTQEKFLSEVQDICYSIVQHGRRLAEATNGDDAYDAREDLERYAKKLDALLTKGPETIDPGLDAWNTEQMQAEQQRLLGGYVPDPRD